ncbi:TPA: hypothetical protein ACF632_005437, partial [Salmonella enterica]
GLSLHRRRALAISTGPLTPKEKKQLEDQIVVWVFRKNVPWLPPKLPGILTCISIPPGGLSTILCVVLTVPSAGWKVAMSATL